MSSFLNSRFFRSRPIRGILFILVLFILVILLWPSKLPKYEYSTIINDSHGQLLSAKVAADGQWRFPKP
ncbi:MAG: hypothetical protein RIF46_14545, partial [Cyclobacteriaceae bacterium]